MNKEFITYQQYDYLLQVLVHQIMHSSIFKNLSFIYTFMRGGLPIAVHLSHFLDLPVYTDEKEIDFTKIYSGTVLIVDDIADTGITLDGKQFLFPTATLFYKPRSSVIPTFYAQQVPSDVWIVMPWEKDDEIPNRSL